MGLSRVFEVFRSLIFLLFILNYPLASVAQDIPVDTEKWALVWADEFEGSTLDLSKWSYNVDCWGGGNNERQCYTDRQENVAVDNGILKIKAIKEKYRGPAFPPHMQDTPERAEKTKKRKFTSGRIVTKNKGDWTYGRFDIRAKMPTGQGTWPAIWMLPTDNVYGGWAASGEIDIMEAVNLGAKCGACANGIEDQVHGTIHFGGEWPDNRYSGEAVTLPNAIDDWHVYSVVWSAGVITWYVDGEPYARRTLEYWKSNNPEMQDQILAPFDQRFHMILNLAIGGNWPESENDKGVDKSGFPKTMEVDYVRVYQCISDPELGLDCVSF